MPTLALAGSLDVKFSVEAVAIAQGVNNGQCELVDDARHAAHLEQPEATATLIESWLAD
jgi:pimeloyl-ACP methyl ester carboxylesterase